MAIFGAIAATALILIFPSVSVAVLAIAGLSVGVTAAASLGFVVGAVVGILLIGIAKATTFALGNIKLLLGKFLRNLLSVIYTNEQIDKLQKAESNTQPEFFEGNSSKDILKYMGEDGQLPNNVVDAKESLDTKPTARRHSSPAEIMTDEPATPWNSNTP